MAALSEPSDYEPILSVLNDWWGGRNMSDMLPKLFFVHFRETSFVAESEGKNTLTIFGMSDKNEHHLKAPY